MTSPSTSPSGSRPRVSTGRGLSALREVLDDLRPGAGDRVPEPQHAGARDAVLEALAEQPRSGYAIVRALEERGAGERTPGAGAVYPMLQLLADEGLATAEDVDGTRVWTLTVAGRAAADAARARPSRTDAAAGPATSGATHRTGILRSGALLGQVVAIAAQGTPREHVGEVVAILDDARRGILAILARG